MFLWFAERDLHASGGVYVLGGKGEEGRNGHELGFNAVRRGAVEQQGARKGDYEALLCFFRYIL